MPMYCREELGRLINLDSGVSTVDATLELMEMESEEYDCADSDEEGGLVAR
jgi:hypothetical protein